MYQMCSKLICMVVILLQIVINANSDRNVFEALETNDLDTLVELIQSGIDVNAQDNNGKSVLHYASLYNNIDFVEYLLDHGADVNVEDTEFDYTPLLMASAAGNTLITKRLLKYGAKVNAANTHGETALWLAASEGRFHIVKALIAIGKADVNKVREDDQTSPLYIAAQNGQADIVRYLVQHRALVDIADDEHVTPLCIASQNGHTDIVSVLLEHKANVNSADSDGITALMQATRMGHVKVVTELLQHPDINVDQLDVSGSTPFIVACANNRVDITKLLVDANADINVMDTLGRTCSFIVELNGFIEIEDYLKGKLQAKQVITDNVKVEL